MTRIVTISDHKNASLHVISRWCLPALLALLVSFWGSGCATGSSVSSEQASKIIEGQTTKEEVRALLGKPMSTLRNGDGTEMWMYSYNDVRQKSMLQGAGLVGTTMLGAFVPGAGIASTAGHVAVANANPETNYQSTTISFNAAGVVTQITHQEGSTR